MSKSSFMFYPEITDEDFYEKIYLKKEFRENEVEPKKLDIKEKKSKYVKELEPHQNFLKNYISPDTPYNGILVYHMTGTGKCHAKGTNIILHDGTLKKVEDIQVGDLLMGDDSSPRKVLSLARGVDKMYDVIPSFGKKYTVNSEHILCFKTENDEDRVLEIAIKDYLKLSKAEKRRLRGYRVSVEFPEKYVDIDPYIFATSLKNPFISIPDIYKYNSRENRLKLLAGIIDTTNLKFQYDDNDNNNNHNLINDIIYVAQSLGFYSFAKKYYKNIKIHVIGREINEIPIKINVDCLNKNKSDNQSTNQLITEINIKYVGKDDYYGFMLDGNCRYLIEDFTVTHNTCTAISIAEGFKKTLKNINKKILVLSTLKKNFENEIYDYKQELRKMNPDDNVQCTGKEYELGPEYKHLTHSQREREIIKNIKSYYQFMGYTSFANEIMNNTGGWKGEEENINEQIKKFISKEFDDRVIIIDEIQNIKTTKTDDLTKNIQPILYCIIKYAKNVKLILMSATPMFDRPDEIIFYINLLLLNDGRKTMDKTDIFNLKDGTLKDGAEKKLREAFKGYVSYIRSEKPDSFPLRIYPRDAIIPKFDYFISGMKIEEAKKLKYTKILLCDMKNIQANTYLNHLKKKILQIENNIIDNVNEEETDEEQESDESIENINKSSGVRALRQLSQISNIVFPVSINKKDNSYNKNSENKNNYNITLNSDEIKYIGSIGNNSINADYDNGYGGYYKTTKIIGQKKVIKYKYQSHAIFNKDTVEEAPFADQQYLSHYSAKFAKILEEIKNAKGLVFVYSQYIPQGTLPFALMLEQNGFKRDCIEGEERLLDYEANKLRKGGKHPPICYLCGKEASYKEHLPTSANFHVFKQAKYILFFGKSSDIIKIRKEDALKKFSSNNNKYGEEIKVFIGTKTVSEGLDFKRIRQIHILEPWYNLSLHEQIIGRGIRRNSHIELPEEERNCEIFQYASVISKKMDKKIGERESIDIKNYRIGENKDIIIKKISRIMKESAVDCLLFRNANIISENKKVKHITASGQVLNIPIADVPYSQMCDYNSNCNYQCNWMPNPRVKYPVNTDTYNIRFASKDIDMAKKYIKKMYRSDIIYPLSIIENYVKENMPKISELFIYDALNQIVNNKNEFLYDKFSRKGYLIYRGDYYIFQPFDIQRDDIPLEYREYPSTNKPQYVDIDALDIVYENENKSVNIQKNIENESMLFNKIVDEINDKYKLQINILNTDKTKDHNAYMYAIIGTIYSKLLFDEQVLFVRNSLQKYLADIDKTNQNGGVKIKVKKNEAQNISIHNIINYLNHIGVLINYYKYINPDKAKEKLKMYVAFVIDKNYYVVDSIDQNNSHPNISDISFIKMSPELIYKIKSLHFSNEHNNTGKKFNNIYGIVEFEGTKKFKIVDKSLELDVLTKFGTKSKRKIIKGRTCGNFHAPQLLEIREKLGMYPFDNKMRIDFICNNIEIFLRYMNNIKKNGVNWFAE